MEGNKYGRSDHLSIFISEALYDALDSVFFQSFILHLIKDTDVMYRTVQLSFVLVETSCIKILV